MVNYIRIETVKLSDGSTVFDVHVPQMTLHAIDETAAHTLLDALCQAIRGLTVDQVEAA